MAINTNILTITLDGTGTEVNSFLDVSVPYDSYLLTGTVTATGNYTIVATGVPQLGTKFTFEYNAVLDITTNGTTFQLFGNSLTQAQLVKKWTATLIYNGSSWDMVLQMGLSQSNVIITDNLVDLSVTTAKINNLAVTATKLAADSVITSKILDQNVTTAKIADNAVTTVKILDTNVTTGKLAANAITNAKLAQMADQTIKGNVSGGVADPSDISLSTLINDNAWSLTGNSGTVAGTNFIGTTDAIDFVIKVNNIEAGRINLTDSNTSFGIGSLLVNTTGSDNVAFGYAALFKNTIGVGNTAIGRDSLVNLTTGSNNTAIGNNAGDILTTGSYNTCIGDTAGSGLVNALNRIVLGYGATGDTDYQFALPNDVTSWKIRGNSFTLPSADGSAKAALVTDGSKVLSFGKVIDSDVYTPSLTNGTNVAASTAYQAQWLRVGNVVTVSGKLAIDPTTTGATELGISLPIASNFANDYECGGTANFISVAGESAGILGDTGNNRASLQYIAVDTGNKSIAFTFTYSII